MTAFPSANPVVSLTVQTSAGTITVKGRDAWALNALIEGGLIGVTPIDRPAPRWSHYVFKLRRAGINVETIDEAHGGPYSGHHARYVLRTSLAVVAVVRQQDELAARARRAEAA